ncbi:hypothetical protein PRZ48_009495 [Zasmidium cellare]|uniref:Heterokaryon incompatibility domain-containing protein n=1 Tax=Zasmidium cellare TaxID=395010 RepID=A0ABR0EBV6_ZASCE|nr:hypothetical protein PRZ48_009495 [Zasmidium cellare]
MAPRDPNICYGDCFEISAGHVATNNKAGRMVASVTSNTAYEYLPVKAWQFRILELSPAPRHAPLRGRLIPAMIAMQAGRQVAVSTADDGTGAEISYRALSYTWGSAGQDGVILLDGHHFPITANLHSALTELRELDSRDPTFVWADAICINQKSTEEKSEQVANMLQIYQAAELVEVWLGEAQDDSDFAMTYLKRFANPWKDVTELAKSHTQPCLRHARRHLWPSLLNVCNRAWLRRTWIRQEVYAAKSLTVRCGSCDIPWKCFLTAFSILWLLTSLLPDVNEDIRAAAAIRLLPELHANSAPAPGLSLAKVPRNLVDVLATSQEYLVTEKRDTLFAVLGMCGVRISTHRREQSQNEHITFGKTTSVTVDYKKDLSEIWSDATHYVFAEAALKEPDADDAKEIARRNEEASMASPEFEGVDMAPGDVVDRYPSHIADVLNISNSSHGGSKESPASKNTRQTPAWSLEWLGTRSADEIAALRSLQVPRGSVVPLRWTMGNWRPGILPVPQPLGPTSLRFRGWLYGYVAGLTDLTSDTSDFITAVQSRLAKTAESAYIRTELERDEEELKKAKEAIENPRWHCWDDSNRKIRTDEVDRQRQRFAEYEPRVRENVAKLREVHGPISMKEIKSRRFRASQSDRRLGYITVFDDDLFLMAPQPALLPSPTKPGDLIACSAENVLPLVLRPLSDTVPGQLAELREWLRSNGDFDDVLLYHDHDHWKTRIPFRRGAPDDLDSRRLQAGWNRRRKQFCTQMPKDYTLIGSAPFHQWLYHARDAPAKDFVLH